MLRTALLAITLLAAAIIAAAPSRAAVGATIYLDNWCDQPVKLFIRHKLPGGNWQSTGWFALKAYDGLHPRHNGAFLLHDPGLGAQIYGYTLNRRRVWEGQGTVIADFDNGRYNMRMFPAGVNPETGDYRIKLTCD